MNLGQLENQRSDKKLLKCDTFYISTQTQPKMNILY